MDSSTLIMIEGGLIAAGVLGFGIWQIVSLKRERRRDAKKNDSAPNRFRD